MSSQCPDRLLVAVGTYGESGASTRVRIYDWLRHLGVQAEKHEYLGAADVSVQRVLAHAPLALRSERSLRRLAGCLGDATVLLSRAASPLSTGGLEVALLRSAQRGVYDFDDALYADRRGGVHRAFAKPRIWRRAVEAADVVIAGNDRLAEHAGRHSSSVVVIPSCVEPGAYRSKESYELRRPPRVVWVGSPTTEQYLEVAAAGLRLLHDRTGARLRVVSSGSRHLSQLDGLVDRVAWSPQAVVEELAAADIAIAPLTDDAFSRGKCAYKLLQYGAAGVPFVASPVGVNAQVIEDLAGLPAQTTAQWGDRLLDLVQAPPGERAALGAAARRGTVAGYSYAAWAPAWCRAMGLAFEGRRGPAAADVASDGRPSANGLTG